MRHIKDDGVHFGHFGCLDDLLMVRLHVSVLDVVEDAVVEKY